MDNNDLSQIKSLVDERLQMTRGDVQRATKDAAEATEASRRAKDEASRLEAKLEARVRDSVLTLEEKIEASQPNPLVSFLSQGAIVMFAMVGLATVFSLVSSFLFWQIHDVRTRKIALEAKFEKLSLEFQQVQSRQTQIFNDISDDEAKFSKFQDNIGYTERAHVFIKELQDRATSANTEVSELHKGLTATESALTEKETQIRSLEEKSLEDRKRVDRELQRLWRRVYDESLPDYDHTPSQIPAKAQSVIGEVIQ